MVAMSNSTETRAETNADRLSNLPDHVAHNILSLLSMEDISRLCVVSKRCRELSISIPNLAFDSVECRNNATKQGQLMSYLDRFWLLRKGMDTRRFYLRWCSQSILFDDEERHLLTWLENAVMCNVELLDVVIILKTEEVDFPMPPNVLRSKSLKNLRINLNYGILIFPSSITSFGFSSLQNLSLNSVQIDESFGEWISSCCKFIRKVRLSHIRGSKRLIITSASLEEFMILFASDLCHIELSAKKLQILGVDWGSDSSSNKALQLSAPKLRVLILMGDISNFSSKDNFIHSGTTGIFIRNDSYSSNSSTQCLLNLLRGVRNTKILYLHDMCIKHGRLPFMFINLSTLYIYLDPKTISISDSLLLALPAVLAGTPNLLNLYVGNISFSIPFDEMEEVYDKAMGSRESHNSMVIPNLKSVITNFNSVEKNELELIKYLLKQAKNLKKMTIFNAPPLESDIIREIRQYEKSAEVIFHEQDLSYCP
ncbi:hypothetical protein UlMin_036436 [Ulmus minor]